MSARAGVMRFWGAIPIGLTLALLALRGCLATPPLSRLAPAGVESPSPTPSIPAPPPLPVADAGAPVAVADAAAPAPPATPLPPRHTSHPTDPPNTIALAGSLDIARGGPVIIGFQTDQPARLTVGDHELAGRGLIKDRIVLPAGPVAIRFAVPTSGSARLVWSPVGRRGDPEYVPASSLSPEPPERATFPAGGTARLDGVIALVLLLVLVGSLCMLARRRLRAVPRTTWIAMGAVFAIGCFARWIDLSGFGQTWDEDVNWAAGRNYVTNVLGLDLSPGSWIWNLEHPPVMKYLAGIGAQFADGFGPARALSAVWTALGCALLVPIGARLYRLRVGVLAAGIAALLPPLVAHGQIVGHESPTVLWWALGVLLALGVHDPIDGSPPSRRAVLVRLGWIGVVIGVATASRFVNGMLGPLCLAIVIVDAPRPRRLLTALEAAALMPAAAFATLYVLWPRLWAHPFAALGESLDKLTRPHTPEPFLGAMTNHPGPHYFLVYLAATLPIGVLAGVVAWCVRSACQRDRAALIAALFFLVPLGVVASPVRQDGVRYVMPSVLALALLGAAGWDYLATLAERRLRHAFVAVSGALALYLVITLVRIHPYYLDYFGEQVGGPGTVARAGWFETAWWGEGVDRAVDYVNEHAAPHAKVFRDCIEPAHLAWFREDLWTPMAHVPGDAEWIVTYSPITRRCPVPPDARRVFSVDAGGAPLAEVWQRGP